MYVATTRVHISRVTCVAILFSSDLSSVLIVFRYTDTNHRKIRWKRHFFLSQNEIFFFLQNGRIIRPFKKNISFWRKKPAYFSPNFPMIFVSVPCNLLSLEKACVTCIRQNRPWCYKNSPRKIYCAKFCVLSCETPKLTRATVRNLPM